MSRRHRLGELDPRDPHTASGKGQRDPSGADGELQRRTVAGETGEEVHGRTEHTGVEHRSRLVVVAGGDLVAEVVLEHVETLAPARSRGQRVSGSRPVGTGLPTPRNLGTCLLLPPTSNG
jgi:hypothetical protein